MIGDATPTAAAAVHRGGTPRVPAQARWTVAMRDDDFDKINFNRELHEITCSRKKFTE
jgi:hypothetical protein